MNYIRKISDGFINDLLLGQLKELLKIVKYDSELQLEIRDNYISIYYLGGCLLKVQPKGSGYRFNFDIRFCLNDTDNENNRKNIENIKNDDIASWINIIPALKREMYAWFKKHNKLERNVQQYFCRDNANENSRFFVIDMEYQTGSESRVDMLALSKNNIGTKIVLVELKQGYKAIAGKSGLIKHYNDFSNLIKNRRYDLIETISNIYSGKVSLGLIPDCFDLSVIAGFEILFVLYDYNDNSKQLKTALKDISNLNAQYPFDCIKVPQKVPKETFTIKGEF